jgi:hypothetical protein
MRIDANKRLNGAARTTSSRSANGGEVFHLGDPKQPERAGAAGGASSISGVESLLALQAVGGEPQTGPRLRHGHDVLDLLDDIKVGLLSGGVPAAKLESLLDSLRRRPARIDGEHIEHVLDEIELRARVELAKRGREAA